MTCAALAVVTASAAALPAAACAATSVVLSVSTQHPADITPAGATLRAKVQVSALGANVSFQYGTTTSYGATSAAASTSVLGLSETLTVPVDLQPSTTYHVRAIATSGFALAYGRDLTFSTGAHGTPPVAGGGDDADQQGDPGSGSSGSGAGSGSGSGSSGSGSSGSGSGSGSGSPGSGSGSGSRSPVPAPGSAAPGPGSSKDVPSTGTTPDAGGPDDTTGDAPTPTLGRTVAAEAVRGMVTVTAPSGAPVDLSAATALPSGTVIDTRKGTVELTSALDRRGTTQTGRFWGGVFEVRQSATAKGLTQLVLRGGDFSSCRAAAGVRARAAAAKKPPRALWGSDRKGRFQTRGRGSVATVRGTRWLTEDRCEGTRTRVVEGAVAVYDLARSRTTVVTRGHDYLARVNR
jgi:hypothetical protein